MLNTDEFRKYLAIDKQALDDEIIQRSSLLFEVSEAYATAVAERDALKEQLAVTDAELDGKLRKANEKGTEALIKNQIQAHNDHRKAFAEWLEAKEHADKLGALKDAFKDRSHALGELADLYVANYFDTASVRQTPNDDTTVYRRRRARLAASREAKS